MSCTLTHGCVFWTSWMFPQVLWNFILTPCVLLLEVLAHFMVSCSWLKGSSYDGLKLLGVLVAFAMILFLVMVLFLMFLSFPWFCSFLWCDFWWINPPPFLFGICDGPLLMLVLFLVLFILLMMNWNPLPFSCVRYGHLLSLGPLPSVFELPSRCCPFSWCNSQWIETPPFFSVHNGLILKVGPFPNVLELPVVMLLSLVQLLISKPTPLSLLFIMVVFIVLLLFLVFLSFPWCYSFFWCGSWWIWTPLFGVCDGPLPNVNPFLMQVLS
jgi:hypothetical protein